MRQFGRAFAGLLLAVTVPACGNSGSPDAGATSTLEGFKPMGFWLDAPTAGATGVALLPTFSWGASSNAQSYRLQVATTLSFASPVLDITRLYGLSYTPAVPLLPGTTYWWRAWAITGANSTLANGAPSSFSTLALPQLRRVAFQSDATNLVAGDTNDRTDMFVRDIVSGTTTRASVGPSGEELPFSYSAQGAMTPDGKFLAFQTNSSVWVRDLDSGAIQTAPAVPAGYTIGGSPSISADGRMVAYTVFLIGGVSDIHVWDRQTNSTTDISVTPAGSASSSSYCYSPAVSGNGRYVAWQSGKDDLVVGDTNGVMDVFVRDLQTNTTERVSLNSAGAQGNSVSSVPAISADGRFVAFSSYASNLVPGDVNNSDDIFVRDRQLGTTEMVSVSSAGVLAGPNGGTEPQPPSISADGRYVAFEHAANNLVPGDTNGTYDIFVRDRQAGTTRRVSVSSAGIEGNGESRWASIFPGGGYVAFVSSASNLVAGDTNGVADIFLFNLATSETTRLSVSSAGVEGNQGSNVPVASAP
jgi:Tol biopolymer transport system component